MKDSRNTQLFEGINMKSKLLKTCSLLVAGLCISSARLRMSDVAIPRSFLQSSVPEPAGSRRRLAAPCSVRRVPVSEQKMDRSWPPLLSGVQCLG